MEGAAGEEHGDASGMSEGESSAPDEDPELAAARILEEDQVGTADLQHDALPSFGEDDGLEGDIDGDEWRTVGLEGQVSAAGPAAAGADVVPGTSVFAATFGPAGDDNIVADADYWFSRNIATSHRAREWRDWWQQWKGSAVDDDVDVSEEWDVHQRFLYDLMDLKKPMNGRSVVESPRGGYTRRRV